jgi:hypothetical protein
MSTRSKEVGGSVATIWRRSTASCRRRSINQTNKLVLLRRLVRHQHCIPMLGKLPVACSVFVILRLNLHAAKKVITKPVELIPRADTEACCAGTVSQKLHPLLHTPPNKSKNLRITSPNALTEASFRFTGTKITSSAKATYPTHIRTNAVMSKSLGRSVGIQVGDPEGIRVGEWKGDQGVACEHPTRQYHRRRSFDCNDGTRRRANARVPTSLKAQRRGSGPS